MCKWGCTGTLPDKEISLKLYMLLAFTTFSRASNLHCHDIKYMLNNGDDVTFYFHKLHKVGEKKILQLS